MFVPNLRTIEFKLLQMTMPIYMQSEQLPSIILKFRGFDYSWYDRKIYRLCASINSIWHGKDMDVITMNMMTVKSTSVKSLSSNKHETHSTNAIVSRGSNWLEQSQSRSPLFHIPQQFTFFPPIIPPYHFFPNRSKPNRDDRFIQSVDQLWFHF